MTETQLVQSIRAAVGSLPGVFCERMNTGAVLHCLGCGTSLPRRWQMPCPSCGKTGSRMVHYGTPGGPDIRLIVSGRFLGLECKAAKGRQSEDQKNWQRWCEAAGGRYVVVRSVEEAVAAVNAMRTT